MTEPLPPVPWQPPQQPPQPQVMVTHQMIETKRHGLTGPHVALIITGVLIGLPFLICLLCTLGGAISSGSGH